MRVAKVLNNNIAVAVDDAGNDVIVMGSGVAFQKKHGETIDDTKIERVFTHEVDGMVRRIKELALEIPVEYFDAASEIITQAKVSLGKCLSDSLYVVLTDHIFFSVARSRNGVNLQNGLINETRLVYRDEYRAAKAAVQYLNRRFQVSLTDDEAAFITMHFVNASTGASMSDTLAVTKLVNSMLGIIERELGVTFEEGSLDCFRLLIHLKLFSQHVVAAKEPNEAFDDKALFRYVRQQYPISHACALKIAAFIEEGRDYHVPEAEYLYLTIHIERVRARVELQG